MADLSDVRDTLVSMIGALLYPPDGVTQPCILGSPARIRAGWPVPTQLDADMAASPSVTNVFVYPAAMNRNTTRFMDQWQTISTQTPTLSLVRQGQTITVGGAIPDKTNPHNLVAFVNGKPYTYQATWVDSLASAASKLGALIAQDWTNTTVTGALITLPANAVLGSVRVGVTGVAALETRRQEQVFQIGCWASTPELRDLFGKTVDGYLAQILRFETPDTSSVRLIWKNSLESDKFQKQTQYRRDLFYTCEYPTLDIQTQTQITSTVENVSAGPTPEAATPVATIYDDVAGDFSGIP